MEWITDIHQPALSIHREFFCWRTTTTHPWHQTSARAAPSWTCQVRIQAPVSMSFWTTMPSLLPGKHADWQRNFMVSWKAQHNGRNFRMEPLYTVISLEINHVQVQLLASSIFEPNLKCLWLFSQMPAWKDKATSKATREDRTRLTSRIKMEWMFEAKGKIEGIWHKDFGNCNSKLFQNLESYDMGPGCFNKY